MWYVGIDLHGYYMITAARKQGKKIKPMRIGNQDREKIQDYFTSLGKFKAVIEASGTYMWLYDMLKELGGEVVIAHPLKLKAIGSAKVKTDKIDSIMLAKLLEGDLIPCSYVPSEKYRSLRDITQYRCRMVRARTLMRNRLSYILLKKNVVSPYKNKFCKRGEKWFRDQSWNETDNFQRDQLLDILEILGIKIEATDKKLLEISENFPEVAVLQELRGIGLYTALVIIGEIAEPERFGSADQVAGYTGLCAKVSQSGKHCYHGHITREGSAWLRWILVEAALKLVRKDEWFKRFYQRIRKRRGKHVARVATARKLVRICWHRLIKYRNNVSDFTPGWQKTYGMGAVSARYQGLR